MNVSMPKNRESVDFSTEGSQKDFEQLPREDQQHILDRSKEMALAADPEYTEARDARKKLDQLKLQGLESTDEWYKTRTAAEISKTRAETQEVLTGAAFEAEQIAQESLSAEYERVKSQFEKVYKDMHEVLTARDQAEKSGDNEEYHRLWTIGQPLYREVEHLDALRGKIWERLQSKNK